MIYGKADPALVQVLDCRYGRMMSLANDRYMGRAFARYGEYSEGEVELWRAMLAPNAIVADVGANIGAHTVALARLVPQGMVFAFEPLPYLFYGLCGNLFLNGLTNVKAVNACVGNAPGRLLIPALDYTHQGVDANYGGMNMEGHPQGVPSVVVTLDDCCQRLDFLKVDVEGMERKVLEGARRIISTHRPALYVENNAEPEDRHLDLIRYIQSLGYDCWYHCPPLFNPGNYRNAPIDDDLVGIASHNMICLPTHPDNLEAMGREPIARP